MSQRTFQEIFCERNKYPKERFMRRVFWRTLYPHAVLAAPLFLIFNYEYFAPDRDLIAAAGRAADLKHIREEVREFFWDPNNKGWLRRRLFIRVSGQRLKNLARRYLPDDGGSTAPHDSAAAPG